MNFDYIRDAKPETEERKALYDSLADSLDRAEAAYWEKPQKCGMLLLRAADTVCCIYNCYYGIGFAQGASLEDYLCYTGDEAHNAMVSRFLSVIRKEQRDRLEWIRVWGEECVFMDTDPAEHEGDKLYLNVKKMMVSMLDVTREMCRKIDRMEDLDDWVFEDDILPGYRSLEEPEETAREQKREKKGHFSFWKRSPI